MSWEKYVWNFKQCGQKVFTEKVIFEKVQGQRVTSLEADHVELPLGFLIIT